jgi:hypothetical protein
MPDMPLSVAAITKFCGAGKIPCDTDPQTDALQRSDLRHPEVEQIRAGR